jgi:outer membrane protein TolC
VRASVRAAEATASARSAAIRVARADLLPSFNLTFTSGFLALPRANGFPTIFEQLNGWYPDQSFQFFFLWPLFDGLRAKGAIDLAQAQEQLANLELRRVREDATIDVARAQAELARARAVAVARENTVLEAEEAFELASLRFSRGIGTQLEVSDAQLAMLTARSTDARATFDLYLAVAELARVRAQPIPLPDGGSVSTRISR